MTLQIASLTLVGTLVASPPAQVVTQMSRVSGQVIEDGTSRPVADARVFVVLDDERAAADGSPPEVLSDRDGRYRFDMLPPGRYHIAAQKDGFAPPMDPSSMQIFEVAMGPQAWRARRRGQRTRGLLRRVCSCRLRSPVQKLGPWVRPPAGVDSRRACP